MRTALFRWGAPETEHAKRIRFEVFCDEQRVPEALELDEIDEVATHVLLMDDQGVACATGRLFPSIEDASCGRIGRMAVLSRMRGRGCGSRVLLALVEEGLRQGFVRFVLDSQVHAIAFYERHGFSAYGDEHMDAGIPHRMMEISAERAAAVLREMAPGGGG